MRPPRSSRTSGFTLVELLVAAFVLVIILSIVAAFFVQQTRLNRRTQAGTEVQDKARMVMQLVTGDLQLAGADVYSDTNGAIQTPAVPLTLCPNDSGSGLDTCLVGVDGGVQDRMATTYITTLRPTSTACRQVGYAFSGTTLERADVACSGSPGLVDTSSIGTDFDVLAPGILALDIRYLCSNGNILSDVPDATDCASGDAYLRTAIVTVVARSEVTVPGQPAVTYQVPMSDAVSTKTAVTCGPDYACSGLTQEVLLPNLKDR